ncbi:MAG: hypothetical protein AAF591_05665 [Verrucomicrobiota bacterium]
MPNHSSSASSPQSKARRKHKPYVHVPEPEPWEAAIPEQSNHSPFGYLITGILVLFAAAALWLMFSRYAEPSKKGADATPAPAPLTRDASADPDLFPESQPQARTSEPTGMPARFHDFSTEK